MTLASNCSDMLAARVPGGMWWQARQPEGALS